MNQYGRRVQRHWQRYLPRQYAQLADPEEFFGELGETLADQISDLADDLAGPDRPGEGYLAKLGRLQMARLNAEDEVMRENLPEPETPPDAATTPTPETTPTPGAAPAPETTPNAATTPDAATAPRAPTTPASETMPDAQTVPAPSPMRSATEPGMGMVREPRGR